MYAWRSWKNAKGVALLAATALAVGIGSTTAIYTVVHAVLLKPLPYREGERFVALYAASFAEAGVASVNYPDVVEFSRRTHSFDVFGWFRNDQFNLTSPGRPEHVGGVDVTAGLANSFGVNPIAGRWFRDGDGYSVAVISSALAGRLGGRDKILGQAISLNGRSYTVLGVMPPWFRLIGGPGVLTGNDIWLPLDPHVAAQDSASSIYFIYARRKPGVSFAAAEADAKAAAAQIAKQNPAGHAAYTAELADLREIVTREIRPTLLLLFGAAGLLLLITCANVAGLLVARSVVRSRETAVRVALGARPLQLALDYFSEGLLVSLVGAAAGVLLSFALVRLVVALGAKFIPRADEIRVDGAVLLFALCAACLASLVFSLAPLWQAIRTPPNEALSDGTRSSEGLRSRKLSQSLVVVEIAVAFTLLAASAVLIAQLDNLRSVQPGFDANHLLTFQLDVPEAQYGTAAKSLPYEKRLIQALAAIPGVENAALINHVPVVGCCFVTKLYPEGRVIDPNTVQSISFLVADPSYWPTMRIPLLEGRLLNERDTRENPAMVVINRAAAKFYWPHRSAVGAYARISAPNGDRLQIVGVVGDTRNQGLGKPSKPEIYFLNALFAMHRMHFMVRSSQPESALVPEIRKTVQSVNAEQPIHDIQSMRDVIGSSLSLERVSSLLTGFFALAALLMATLGVYGVVAYSVRHRTVEIGTRMALGAVRRDLLSLVVGGGLKMALYGVVLGGFAAAVATWLLLHSYRVQSVNALPFVYSTALVAGVVALACFIPAWRATLLSPMVAIRNEPGSMWQTKTRQRPVSEGPPLDEGMIMAEFVEAARHAKSFPEAIRGALATLREAIGATSAVLLEKPENPFLLNRLKFYSAPVTFAESDFKAWRDWAAGHKPDLLEALEELERTDARLAVALRTKNEISGVLLLGAPAGREEYGAQEKRVLRSCAAQFALMLENARLTERVVEQEKLRRDVELAAEVQRRLLPEKSPESSIAGLAAVSLPARSVGGDYYDFIDAGGHRIGIALADIAGKGVAAALVMSVVQASLRILAAEENISLPELAARMNRFLYRSTGSNSYATFFYAQLDEQTRELHYVNAGHNPPYLLRSGAGIEELPAGGTVIGMFPQEDYQEARAELRSGDVLIAFTDGVTEALNPGEEEFGEERLKELLRRTAHLPADEMSAEISRELHAWIADAAQYDDLTFIVLKVH
ncbi:MAG TPA: ADOP family duplicated permease [Bryobacteraceae bacterium]